MVTKGLSDKSVENFGKVIRIDEVAVKQELGDLVRNTVEDTLNALLDAEADSLCGAGRYERNGNRKGYRSGHYSRKFQTKSGDVTLRVPKLKKLTFESAIIDRYRRRESSVEEALIEMYLAGVSVRRVEDITEALWGSKVSPGTISNLNKKVYSRIEEWRNRSLSSSYRYVYVDGIWLKRSWGGEIKNVAVLVAIGVNREGYREVLGAAEGSKEDYASWLSFFRHLKERGLDTIKLLISDKCLGLLEALAEVYPEADWQRCVVHWYRNVLKDVPRSKAKDVAAMLKAIHAQEDLEAAKAKAHVVVEKLRSLKLKKAAEHVLRDVHETLTYMNYPREHWRKIRSNNVLERLNREIRRRTRVVGAFPDGNSALMLVAARLRHIESSHWGLKRYMKFDFEQEELSAKAELSTLAG